MGPTWSLSGPLWICVLLYEEMKFGYLHVQKHWWMNEKLMLKGCSLQRVVKLKITCFVPHRKHERNFISIRLNWLRACGPWGYPLLWKEEDQGPYGFSPHTHIHSCMCALPPPSIRLTDYTVSCRTELSLAGSGRGRSHVCGCGSGCWIWCTLLHKITSFCNSS